MSQKFPEDVVERAWNRVNGHCESCNKQLAWKNRGRYGRGAWEPHHSNPNGTSDLRNCRILCTIGNNCHLNEGHGGDYSKRVPMPSKQVQKDECFIVTAVFGSPVASEIQHLRYWRDQNLRKRFGGNVVISGYYRISPPIANFIRNKPRVKSILRKLIYCVIHQIKEARSHGST